MEEYDPAKDLETWFSREKENIELSISEEDIELED